MPDTARVLAREDAVVVVVDIQDRLASVMEHRQRVIERTRLVTAAASITACPLVVTRQYPKGLGDVVPELGDHLDSLQEAGTVVRTADKVTFDCFAETEFARTLGSLGRQQLVLVGMETHICITQTALSARARGLNVHVVADACCSRDDENHTVALERLRHAGVVVTTAESVAYELVAAAGTPEFKALLAVVKS